MSAIVLTSTPAEILEAWPSVKSAATPKPWKKVKAASALPPWSQKLPGPLLGKSGEDGNRRDVT
jgi:hypothetical protein